MRFLYDTAVFVYALGREHPYRDPCRDLVELAEEGTLVGDASVELVQEFAYVRLRRTVERSTALAEVRAVAAVCRLQPFDRDVLTCALSLLARHDRLNGRDSVHAATALLHGIEVIVSPDRVFDRIDGLERVDPAEAVERLTG